MLSILLFTVKLLALAYGVGAIFAAAVAAHQESKIWQSKSLPSLSLLGMFKVFLFNVVWMVVCFIGVIYVGIKSILLLGSLNTTREGQFVERLTAALVLRLFVGDIQVIGKENLPPLDTTPAPIYVANHASQIDVAAAYAVGRKFRWVAKQSVLYIPGVGPLMYLANHILIDRKRKNGRSSFFPKANDSVQSGMALFIFPQGTRRITPKLPAKNGAFIVAQENKATLVPLSLEIPMTAWNSFYPFQTAPNSVKMTIHKPIQPDERTTVETLNQKCMDQIYTALPREYTKND